MNNYNKKFYQTMTKEKFIEMINLSKACDQSLTTLEEIGIKIDNTEFVQTATKLTSLLLDEVLGTEVVEQVYDYLYANEDADYKTLDELYEYYLSTIVKYASCKTV